MQAMGVMKASNFLETAIADKRTYSESVTLLTPPKKNTQSSFKNAVRTVILKQKVLNGFNGGGCASSDPPVVNPIDISSSTIDHAVSIFKKVCSNLFDKAWSALNDEFKKVEKEEEEGKKKDGKRKRAERDDEFCDVDWELSFFLK